MNISKLSDQLSEPSIRRKLLQLLIVSYITPSSTSTTNKFSMMPLAPTMSELPTAHKPKIGFSIDSIVGDGEGKDHRSQRPSSVEKLPNCPTLLNPTSPEKSKTALMRESSSSEMASSPLGYLQKHNHFLHHHLLNSEKKDGMSPPMPMLLPNHHPLHQLRLPLMHHHLSPPPPGSNRSSTNYSPGRTSPSKSNNDNFIDSIINMGMGNGSKEQDRASNTSSRSPSPQQPSESPRPNSDIPSSPHEIHRPLVSASHGSPRPGMPGSGHPPHQMPVGPHGLPQFAGYPPGMLNFAMAAAAAAQSHQAGPHHPGIPGWHPQAHPLAPHHHHPAAAAHPLYPWLLAKHSRLFPPRFGPGPDLPGFLFQPFRKPKRIRTAFSPSQLLKLEHAFEKNHYVVGAERKQLAKSLSLSETQVKVWFQNRRTKHKRVETEDDSPMSMKRCDGSKGNGNGSSGSDHPSSGSGLSTSADSSTRNYSEEMSDEDEEIVMDEDYSEEEEMEHGHHNIHHHLHKSYS